MVKRTTFLAAATAALALGAAAPAQAEAQTPSDAIQPIVEGLPHLPTIPAPGITPPPLPVPIPFPPPSLPRTPDLLP